METIKKDILSLSTKISRRVIFIKFTGETNDENTLINLIDYYIQNLNKLDENEIKLGTIFSDIFPASIETLYSVYFANLLILTISHIENVKVEDYESFFLNNILSLGSKDVTDILIEFSSKCFTSLFHSNNDLFIRSINLILTFNPEYSKLILEKITFPAFKSKEDVNAVVSNLVKTSCASGILTAKIIESLSITDISYIPKTVEPREENPYFKLIDYMYSILYESKNRKQLKELFQIRGHELSIVKIAKKFFSIAKEKTVISEFISYVDFFKYNYSCTAEITPEMLENIQPSKVDEGYEIARQLGAFCIHHITSPGINDIVKYLIGVTEYCIENIVVDDSNATTMFVNMLNNQDEQVTIYPYKKIERLCLYLLFMDDSEVRVNSYELLSKTSVLFEKENPDWKEYDFSGQPLYRQFINEASTYLKRNCDFQIDIKDAIVRSDKLQPMLIHVFRRFSNNRPEFAAKVLKDAIKLGDLFPFMITLLFSVLTPYLLRQKCAKKIEIQHRSFFRLARCRPEALSNLDPAYLLEYLSYCGDGDIELFVNLTKSGLLNSKSIQKDQLQEQIDILSRFSNCPKITPVAEAIINVVGQLDVFYPKDKSIDLKEFNNAMLDFLSVSSLNFSLNTTVEEAFQSLSYFLINNGIDYKVRFTDKCDMKFFEDVFTKYPARKDDIIFEALHFIPSVVSKYFLSQKSKSETASKVKPEITGFLFSPSRSEIIDLFRSKFPQIKNPDDEMDVISYLNESSSNRASNELLYYCLDFIKTPFVESVGKRVFRTISCIKKSNPSMKTGKDELTLLLESFMKHPQFSPDEIFFANEEGSYMFFKDIVEYGMPESMVSNFLSKCKFSEFVSRKFLGEEWNYIENTGDSRVNDNSIRDFQVVVSNPQIAASLEKSGNIGGYRIYIRNLIADAVENDSVDVDLFASILSADSKFDYRKVCAILIEEMTNIIKSPQKQFDAPTLNTFFEVCLVVVHMCDDGITREVYNFIDLVLNNETVKAKLFDKSFVANIVKLAAIDDIFFSIITENKMKIKIAEFINIDDDREVRFWYNAIFRKFDVIAKEGFDFILSCIQKALEFNSAEMKLRCQMILALVLPEPKALKEIEKNSITKFVQYLMLSSSVDPKIAHNMLTFIDQTIGPIDYKLTDIDIEVYRNSQNEIKNYFSNILSSNK